MIVSMDLELRDEPGQLVSALEPVSGMGGNILSVVHHREKMTPRGTLSVQITFEIEDDRLKGLVGELESRGIIVARIGEERLHKGVMVILIGHIVHTDIRDSIDAIDSTGYAEVTDLSIVMPGIEAPSSASISIMATSDEHLEKALDILREVADRKELIMIMPVGVNP